MHFLSTPFLAIFTAHHSALDFTGHNGTTLRFYQLLLINEKHADVVSCHHGCCGGGRGHVCSGLGSHSNSNNDAHVGDYATVSVLL